MFGDGNPLHRHAAAWFIVGGADNSPATGDAYQGVYSVAQLDGRAAAGRSSSSSSCSPAPPPRSSRGAVAERIKFPSLHRLHASSWSASSTRSPATGSGAAAGSRRAGFVDFAGSTVVHSIGGWAALAGVLILGPRLGKYGKDGKVNPIPGHNMGLATIGCFILWLGWFGFNPGSTMAADSGRDRRHRRHHQHGGRGRRRSARRVIAWLVLGKPDLEHDPQRLPRRPGGHHRAVRVRQRRQRRSSSASSPACWWCSPCSSSTRSSSTIRSARSSVHLVNGVFGTLCVGLFADPTCVRRGRRQAGLFLGGGAAQLITQLIGIVAIGAFVLRRRVDRLVRCSRSPSASASRRRRRWKASTSASTATRPTPASTRARKADPLVSGAVGPPTRGVGPPHSSGRATGTRAPELRVS